MSSTRSKPTVVWLTEPTFRSGTRCCAPSRSVAEPTMSSPGRILSGAFCATLMAASAYFVVSEKAGFAPSGKAQLAGVRLLPCVPARPSSARWCVMALKRCGRSGCQGALQFTLSVFSLTGAATSVLVTAFAFRPANSAQSPSEDFLIKSPRDIPLLVFITNPPKLVYIVVYLFNIESFFVFLI